MSWSADTFLAALNLATRAHEGQKDPGNGFPYVTHAMKVAAEVMRACAVDPALDGTLAVVCALLHDTVEDTPVTLDEIRVHFGDRVAAGVAALTKDEALPKDQRMRDSLDRIRAQPREVWCVKLADRLTNLEVAPPYWTAERRAAYREEARVILESLRDASPLLAARLEEKIAAYG